MSIKEYIIYRKHYNKLEKLDVLIGTQPRSYLDKLRKKGYWVKKIKR